MATIREIREAKLISREKLADLAGVSLSSIVRLEGGQQKTSEDVADKILKVLGVTKDEVEGLSLYNPMRDRKRRGKAG
jgi:transcriptional regulator with XRE-family HTH domain